MCVYGLKDAPRAWRKRLDQVLVGQGVKALAVDAAVYSSHDKSGNMNMCLSCHVDDLKICGQKGTVSALPACLESQFGKLTLHEHSFEHCGVQHVQNPKDFCRNAPACLRSKPEAHSARSL